MDKISNGFIVFALIYAFVFMFFIAAIAIELNQIKHIAKNFKVQINIKDKEK